MSSKYVALAAVFVSLAAGFVSVAACSAPTATSPLSGHVAKSAPSGPAPLIKWTAMEYDGTFGTEGLPAIARSGQLAVIATRDNDGGRGFPNLALEIRDRTDKLTRRINILDANDFETLTQAGQPGAELERRIAAANRELATLHADHDLVAMTALEVDVTPELPHTAHVDDLVVHWRDARLRVQAGTRTLANVDGKRWLAPTGQRCAQCPPCENPTYLWSVYRAPNIDALVVEIAYRGTDTCWEPSNQPHVVAW